MRIEFRKVLSNPRKIDFTCSSNSGFLESDENASLVGSIERVDSRIIKFQGEFCAKLKLVCVLSSDLFFKTIRQDLTLYFSDGVWDIQSQTSDIDPLEVIEFFDGFIDFGFILQGEVESIRLDYNIKE